MRLGLTQQLRAEQRLVQSPQMIQAMQILQCPMIELQDQIEQELQDNVFLELKETEDARTDRAGDSSTRDGPIQDGSTGDDTNPDGSSSDGSDDGMSLEDKLERQYAAELEQLERRTERLGKTGSRIGSSEESDRKQEVLNNAPDLSGSLAEHLLEQLGMLDVEPEPRRVVEHLIHSLTADGRLEDSDEQFATELGVPLPLVQEAVEVVQGFDPAGIGVRDLKGCLLLQLDRLEYVRPLTRKLVSDHLDDLAMNKLPKIAKATGATIEEIKDSWDFLRTHVNPHPAAEFARTVNTAVEPDVIVDEVEGRFEVRTQRGSVPDLAISSVYRNLLKEARSDPKVYEYLRRKIESAKWFIESVHQRQNTIHRIASEVVRRQEDFLREGVQHLKPMKMQDVADAVGVHISTVSRAISGKYIETPQGIFAMKRFFSGGTVTDSGKVVSQQAVKETLREIVDGEDKAQPMSDDQLVEALAERGVHIARRTVTKYRKALSIPSSSLRRQF